MQVHAPTKNDPHSRFPSLVARHTPSNIDHQEKAFCGYLLVPFRLHKGERVHVWPAKRNHCKAQSYEIGGKFNLEPREAAIRTQDSSHHYEFCGTFCQSWDPLPRQCIRPLFLILGQ